MKGQEKTGGPSFYKCLFSALQIVSPTAVIVV